MAIEQSIDFFPEYSSWESWNGNFVHYFSEEGIPYTSDETQWAEVADQIVQLPRFQPYAPPSPWNYTRWQDWANDLITCVNGASIQGGFAVYFGQFDIERFNNKEHNMHGQQTMKFLNGKAVADAIMANHKAEAVSPKLDAAFKEYMVAKAKEAATK